MNSLDVLTHFYSVCKSMDNGVFPLGKLMKFSPAYSFLLQSYLRHAYFSGRGKVERKREKSKSFFRAMYQSAYRNPILQAIFPPNRITVTRSGQALIID